MFYLKFEHNGSFGDTFSSNNSAYESSQEYIDYKTNHIELFHQFQNPSMINDDDRFVFYKNNKFFYIFKCLANKQKCYMIGDEISNMANDFNPLSYFNAIDLNNANFNIENVRAGAVPNSNYNNCGFIFPYLVDAIFNNEKSIIVYVKDDNNFIQIVSGLYKMLPAKYTRKLSFAYNLKKYDFPNAESEDKIKIYFTTSQNEIMGLNYASYVCLDAVNYKAGNEVNYKQELKPYSKYILLLEERFKNDITDALSLISKSFKYFKEDDTIDDDSLEWDIKLLKFSDNRNIVNAKDILKYFVNTKQSITENQIVRICSYILEQPFDKETCEILFEVFNKTTVNGSNQLVIALQRQLINYLWKDKASNEEYCYKKIIALVGYINCGTNEFNLFIENVFKENKKYNPIFINFIFELYNKTTNDQILIKIAEYFNFIEVCTQYRDYYRVILYDQMKKIDWKGNNALKVFAAILVTLFNRNVINNKSFDPGKKIIFDSVVDYLIFINGEKEENSFNVILDIIKLRDYVDNLKDNQINQFNVLHQPEPIHILFSVTTQFIEPSYIDKLLSKISFNTLINLLSVDVNRNGLINDTEVRKLVYAKCFNIDTIKANIKLSDEIAQKTVEVLKYCETIIEDKDIIKEYLESIFDNDKKRNDICKYRLTFIRNQFNLLLPTTQESFVDEFNFEQGNYDLVDNTLVMIENVGDTSNNEIFKKRNELVESITEALKQTMKFNIFKEHGLLKYFVGGAILCTIEVVAAAFLLYILVPMIQNAGLNYGLISLIGSFYHPEFQLALALVFGLFVSTFFVYYFDTSVLDKRVCLRKAFSNALFFGILPIVCFIAVYILVYYFGDSIIH